MSEADERLYGLMEVVERQQSVMEQTLEKLSKERKALEDERKAIGHERAKLALQVSAVGGATATAAKWAVVESLGNTATIAAKAGAESTAPLLKELSGVLDGAERAEAALRRVVLWASWRLLAWIAGAALAMMLTAWAVNAAILWRDRWDIRLVEANRAVLQAQIAGLQGQVADMQANRDGLVKAGMLAKLQRCGPGNRPCIQVDESAGAFGDGDLRVIRDY